MIIQIIDIEHVAILESKYHAPVTGYLHCIKFLQLSFEFMKAPAGGIELLGTAGRIESSQNPSESFYMVLLDLSRIVLFKKLFKSFVLEG